MCWDAFAMSLASHEASGTAFRRSFFLNARRRYGYKFLHVNAERTASGSRVRAASQTVLSVQAGAASQTSAFHHGSRSHRSRAHGIRGSMGGACHQTARIALAVTHHGAKCATGNAGRTRRALCRSSLRSASLRSRWHLGSPCIEIAGPTRSRACYRRGLDGTALRRGGTSWALRLLPGRPFGGSDLSRRQSLAPLSRAPDRRNLLPASRL